MATDGRVRVSDGNPPQRQVLAGHGARTVLVEVGNTAFRLTPEEAREVGAEMIRAADRPATTDG